LRIQQVGHGKAGAQHGAMCGVQAHQGRVGQVVQNGGAAEGEPPANPWRTCHVALQAQVGEFVQGVNLAQLRVEFQAINHHRVLQQTDVFRA
jgi:hypothetical protein